MVINWNGCRGEEPLWSSSRTAYNNSYCYFIGHIPASCSSLLRNPNVVDLVQPLLRRGLLFAHAHRLVRLYETVSTGSRPPVHSLDHVASGNKTGCRSNQHCRSICFFGLSLVNRVIISGMGLLVSVALVDHCLNCSGHLMLLFSVWPLDLNWRIVAWWRRIYTKAAWRSVVVDRNVSRDWHGIPLPPGCLSCSVSTAGVIAFALLLRTGMPTTTAYVEMYCRHPSSIAVVVGSLSISLPPHMARNADEAAQLDSGSTDHSPNTRIGLANQLSH